MKITKAAADEFRLELSPAEVRIYINCMNETLSEIADFEYDTRMGATKDQIKAIVSMLQAAAA